MNPLQTYYDGEYQFWIFQFLVVRQPAETRLVARKLDKSYANNNSWILLHNDQRNFLWKLHYVKIGGSPRRDIFVIWWIASE